MKTLKSNIAAAVLTLLAVAASAQTVVAEKDYALPKCASPVASVVIGKINCKSANCQSREVTGASASERLLMMAMSGQQGQSSFPGLGDGMGAMLTTMLKETGCFDIQEREAMDEIAKELALVGKKVEVQTADFMISGAITSINMTVEKSQLGAGLIPILGLFESTKKTADIAMDMKIIDISKAKLVDSRTFVANNETSSYKFGAGAFVGVGLVGGGMSSVKGTPMEAIVRDILARVASFSSTKLMAVRTAATATAPVAVAATATAPVAAAPAPAIAPVADTGAVVTVQ